MNEEGYAFERTKMGIGQIKRYFELASANFSFNVNFSITQHSFSLYVIKLTFVSYLQLIMSADPL